MGLKVKEEFIGKVRLENEHYQVTLDEHTPQEALESFYDDPGMHQYIELDIVKPVKQAKNESKEN